jgi:hypothetical protein
MQKEKLNIYTSREWMLAERPPVIMLYPYWGEKALSADDPDRGRFDSFVSNGKEIYNLAESIESCDLALYPCELVPDSNGLTHVKTIAQQAKEAGKQLLVFYNNDDETTYRLDNVILIRTSCAKSQQPENVYAFPGWSLDFLNYFPGRQYTPKAASDTPSVSYCGYVDYFEKRPLQSLFAPKKKIVAPQERRGKAVRTLAKNKNIESNFIIRKNFWAGEIADKAQVRMEYAQNMIGSVYAVVMRGAGNFSYRLYEVLSCGRIPLFVNTDCLLPFDEQIDWKKHLVWLEEEQLDNIDGILLNFHKSKTTAELEAMQHRNRELYERFISPSGYFTHLCSFLLQKERQVC